MQDVRAGDGGEERPGMTEQEKIKICLSCSKPDCDVDDPTEKCFGIERKKAVKRKSASAKAATKETLDYHDDALWADRDCAAYLGIQERTFKEKVRRRRDFPLPLDPLLSGRYRWVAGDVKAWALRGRKYV